MREGSYALGATRAETLLKTIIPAALSGICAAVILGVMRAFGETMVVWMASGNAAQIPEPWYNFLEPIRTLTATIAGDMGEADHVTGSARYHVLFAMALCLLAFSFMMNLASEMIVQHQKKKLGK
jgi:phosphate transport system permease protein